MAQTTRLASFGPFGEFSFFPCFFLILNNIYSYYGYIKGTEGLREGGDEENGPKRRESRRLGHLVSFFFFFLFFFFTYTNHLTATIDTLKLRKYLREVTTKRTGPNDANRVVWAISTCFFFAYHVFF